MARIFYEVTAEIIDQGIADEWQRWMLEEHLNAVRSAGATVSRLVRLDDSSPVYLVHYEFPSREVFDHYLGEHAPRLRQASADRFESDRVRYSRRSGEILSR